MYKYKIYLASCIYIGIEVTNIYILTFLFSGGRLIYENFFRIALPNI